MTFMPPHPKPAPRQGHVRPRLVGAFAYVGAFTDDQLDEHIRHLESWMDFQAEEMEAALNERERRGGACYVLTPIAEAWLLAHADRLEALL